ncbi:hypothetical protein J6590_057892 [Homalodisca vitripennis]|nr:hypothetical protein J6590_057892 [Homalodisca vitripennis]
MAETMARRKSSSQLSVHEHFQTRHEPISTDVICCQRTRALADLSLSSYPIPYSDFTLHFSQITSTSRRNTSPPLLMLSVVNVLEHSQTSPCPLIPFLIQTSRSISLSSRARPDATRAHLYLCYLLSTYSSTRRPLLTRHEPISTDVICCQRTRALADLSLSSYPIPYSDFTLHFSQVTSMSRRDTSPSLLMLSVVNVLEHSQTSPCPLIPFLIQTSHFISLSHEHVQMRHEPISTDVICCQRTRALADLSLSSYPIPYSNFTLHFSQITSTSRRDTSPSLLMLYVVNVLPVHEHCRNLSFEVILFNFQLKV